MKASVKYPFSLTNSFFTSIHLGRGPEVPKSLNLNLNAQTRIREEESTSRIQVDLRVFTVGEQPVEVSIELVALFDCPEDITKPEHGVVLEFVEQRALYMMWPMIAQMIRQVTGSMGMNPLNMQVPVEFELQLEEVEEVEEI